MLQTISGETLRVKLANKKEIDLYFQKIKEEISNIYSENCLYQNRKLVKDRVLNFLNLNSEDVLYNQFKFILKEAHEECEKLYPFLGDLFILKYFDVDIDIDRNFFKYHKEDERTFLSNFKSETSRDFAKWFFKNCSLQRNVIIEKTPSSDILVKKQNDVSISLEYDFEFLGSKSCHTVSNYKFIIIDGFIESVGEIHHLLHNAAESKIPHVIFCFGMADEVKHTIIKNNSNGTTEILPISIKFDEKTINLLNDIAILHDGEVISALKGQTISQEVRKDLPFGRKISLFSDRMVIKPVCEKYKIDAHRNFLNNRINEASADVDTKCLKDRLKLFSLKTLTVYLPEDILNNVEIVRELDYFLKFLTNIDKIMCTVRFGDKVLLIPAAYVSFLNKKVNSFKNVYNNIEKAILFKN